MYQIHVPAAHISLEEQRGHIYDIATTEPQISYKNILDEVDEAVKKESIRRLRVETNIKADGWYTKYCNRRFGLAK